MPRPTGPSNPEMQKVIQELRSRGYAEKSKFLLALAKKLSVPLRRRAEVNIADIERVCSKDEYLVVPGKVLGYGILTKPVTVACWQFSKSAKQKIEAAGGKLLSISELVKKNPKGKNVRIIC